MNQEHIDNKNNHDPVDDLVKANMSNHNLPRAVESSMRLKMNDLRERFDTENRRKAPLVWPWRFAAIASLAALLFAVYALVPARSKQLTWADVVQKFQSVSFFNVTVYEKEDPLDSANQFELWVGRGGKARLRIEDQVVFADKGYILAAYDINTRMKAKPVRSATGMLEMLGASEPFSLDTVLKSFPGTLSGEPQLNENAAIAEDLRVFDLVSDQSSEWMRIWTLRESGLPIWIRVWSPSRGECIDAIFSYTGEPEDEFFSPEAFERKIQSSAPSQSNGNIAYALLKDPGGRPMTPENLFSGYHLPEVQSMGVTSDGLVWVVSIKATNASPNGNQFYGFADLADDIGTKYHRGWSVSQCGESDRAVDVFVPDNYGLGQNSPSKYILTCRTENYGHSPNEVVGTVERTEWARDAAIHDDLIDTNWNPALYLAEQKRHPRDRQRFEQLLAMIPGEPETSELALWRECLRLEVLQRDNQNQQVIEQADRLKPLVLARLTGEYDRAASIIRNQIISLVNLDQLDEAAALVAEVREAVRSKGKELSAQYFDGVGQFLYQKGVPLEQIDSILGEDSTKASWYVWVKEERERTQPWLDHLKEIEQYYKSHPLPEKMELLPRAKGETYNYIPSMTVPGATGYMVLPIQGGMQAVLYGLQPGMVRISADVRDIKLSHDLITRNNVSAEEQRSFLLNELGFEIVSSSETRKIWVAHYDGRKLKPFDEVKAPVIGTGGLTPGAVRSMASAGHAIDELVQNFNMDQNSDWQAKGVLIEDQTGLPHRFDGSEYRSVTPLSAEVPYWGGSESLPLARKWFAEEFGITFTEETRLMTVYEVRSKR